MKPHSPPSKRRYSTFDYTITLTRRHRYLVVGNPEFGFQIAAEAIGMGDLTPAQIGETVLKMYERIHARLFEMDRDREAPPIPLSQRGAHRLAPRELLSSSQAARALGVSPQTLRNLVRDGALKAEHTPGGHFRIPLDEIAEFIRSKQPRADGEQEVA